MPRVILAASFLKSGILGVGIRRGEVRWPDKEWEPLRAVSDLEMVRFFLVSGYGTYSRRAMSAAIRLAEGYAPEEIWKVKRHGK